MGRFYTDEKNGGLRVELEKAIFRWADVSKKSMFGCPCYFVGPRLFAFISDQGVVLVGLPPDLSAELVTHAEPFMAGKKRMASWHAIPASIAFADEFAWVKRAYAACAAKGGTAARSPRVAAKPKHRARRARSSG